MKFTIAALILFLMLTCYVYAVEETDEPTEDDPFLYTEADFQETVGVQPHFVMFFAPWCGHCQSLKPAWSELSEYYNVENTDIITIAKVDCTVETKLCSDNDVTGYPTLKLFQPQKEPVRYKESRNIASFKKFISTSLGLEKDDPKETEDGAAEAGLYDLTSTNFDKHIATGAHFIKFFAPWCGHCKRMEPTWKELAAKFENHETVKISRVDCTQHQKVCTSNGVRGYPTLIWFKDGQKIANYESGRTLKDFVSYIEGKTSPGQEEKTGGDEEVVRKTDTEEEKQKPEITDGLFEITNENIDLALESGDIFIKFFAPWCGHCRKMEPAWIDLAKFFESEEDIIIARVDCTKNSEVCTSNGVRGYPTLKYFHEGKAVSETPGGRDFESLKKFVKKMLGEEEEKIQQEVKTEDDVEEEEEEVKEGLYELTAANYETMTKSGDFFIKFFAPWCGHCRKMEPAWMDLAKFYKNDEKVHIGRVDCTKHSSICGSVGVRGYPTLKYFRDGEEVEGSPEGRDIDNLKKFVEEMSGKPDTETVEPEQVEEEAAPGALELDADTFSDVIATGVTFVKFYAPWCGHCKRLAPVWDELALEDFGQVSKPVRIVKVDCTKHKSICKEYEVRGYPTLKLFESGEEKAKHSGARTLVDLKQFVIKSTSEATDEKVEMRDEL